MRGSDRDRIKASPKPQPVTPSNPADADLGVPGSNEDARLDEALEETFPASDPIATRIE